MKLGFYVVVVAGAALVQTVAAKPYVEPRVLTNVKPLPVALDPAFQFRKEKLFLMTEQAPMQAKEKASKKDINNGSQQSSSAGAKSTAVVQEASITFERQYRLYGAVTHLDQRQRFGNYFDFYWRAKRPAANLTVRLEYRQEKLHAHVQAQEVSYANVKGSTKTEFRVIGDDFDGGRVIAWHCCLVENGRVVAEKRSYLWD